MFFTFSVLVIMAELIDSDEDEDIDEDFQEEKLDMYRYGIVMYRQE